MKRKYDNFTKAKNIYDKGLPLITYENLTLLATYARRVLKYGDVRTEKLLLKYCLDCEENFSEVSNAGMISSAIKFSKLKKLEDVEKVSVYTFEIDAIQKIKDFKVQVFVLSALIYSKANNPNAKKYSFSIHIISEILDLANIKMTTATFIKNYYFLIKSENLSMHKFGRDYFEILVPKKIGDVAFEVTKFKNIRQQYIDYIGMEFFYCKECNKKTEKKSGSQTYCNDCAKNRRKIT